MCVREREREEAEMASAKEKKGLCFALLIALILASSFGWSQDLNTSRTVTYDHRALVIDGKRRVLVSASIHYPRSTPEMWPDLIAKAKEGGADVIETYVFWNMHEPVQGTYDFNGRLDLVRFLKDVQKAHLYAHLRIGPYVCAEWNYGGFPVWLHYLPGIEFRTNNEPFKSEMEKFTARIVHMMKEQQLFFWQGGPIILAQIENEYGNVASNYGTPGHKYVQWAAQMAVQLETGVPWIMCQQADAPDPIINTCNGFYCDSFTPNSHKKPKMWTENWSGWFLSFGGLQPHRPVEDLAFATARFYEKGGTFQNYYMYHGGTNFGRTAGGPFIATSYDYDAPIDEYGLIRQPKWGHLKQLHQAIKSCELALILGEPKNVTLGPQQEVHVYKKGEICSAFLANYDERQDATVQFNGKSYDLPAWSVSILPDCKNVIFNTAKVSTQTSVMVMRTLNSTSFIPFSSKKTQKNISIQGAAWSWFKEPTGAWGVNSFNISGFKDQINTTKDSTDYLWYTTSVQINEDENNRNPTLSIHSLGHNMHLFINGELSGSGYGSAESSGFQFEVPISVKDGENEISFLSMTVGLQNYGAFFENSGAGVDGPIALLRNSRSSMKDLSTLIWTHKIGLKGEEMNLHTESGSTNFDWTSSSQPPRYQPMTWYKTTFKAPYGNEPLALDLISMGKGQAWINGESLGRYWPTYFSPGTGCSNTCNYRGGYYPTKCATNCGMPTQRWYHVPRSWLKNTGNLLVLFEEVGGDPTEISFVTRSLDTVCAHVSESHPPPVDLWDSAELKNWKHAMPEIRLECGSEQIISSVDFASFGNPQGTCGNFKKGSCHAKGSLDALRQACQGQESCSMAVSWENFGEDPCPNEEKSLAVQVTCSNEAAER